MELVGYKAEGGNESMPIRHGGGQTKVAGVAEGIKKKRCKIISSKGLLHGKLVEKFAARGGGGDE